MSRSHRPKAADRATVEQASTPPWATRAAVAGGARVLDASAGCTLDQTYTFGYHDRLVAWTDRFPITGGFLVKSREGSARFDAGFGSCRILTDGCDGLPSASRNADVLVADSDEDEVLGNDPRIVDGAVLMVERKDGKKITVGNSCSNNAPSSTPILVGVQALKTRVMTPIQGYDFAPADAGAGFCPAS